ncbi:MAG TPA: hypothetical protein VFR15_18910 [Chloroflexia bacterium]|nr:hypothetical protein [Chloroflexia bacterium]
MLWQRRRLLRRLRETPVEWYFSFDYEDDVPTYRAIVDGTTYKLRAHPPGAVGYTLLMHGKKIADIALTEWPPAQYQPFDRCKGAVRHCTMRAKSTRRTERPTNAGGTTACQLYRPSRMTRSPRG